MSWRWRDLSNMAEFCAQHPKAGVINTLQQDLRGHERCTKRSRRTVRRGTESITTVLSIPWSREIY